MRPSRCPAACTIFLALLFTTILLLGGCNRFSLHGKVIRGESAFIGYVEEDDPRLHRAGIAGVEVSLIRDPDRAARSVAGRVNTDIDGFFDMVLDKFGAGWMDETWELQAVHRNVGRARDSLRLRATGRDRWLLVILGPAGNDPDPWSRDENLMDEFERFR